MFLFHLSVGCVPSSQREPTVRILPISQQPPLRYVTVSTGGHITVWSSSLRILKTSTVSNIQRFRPIPSDRSSTLSFSRPHQISGDPAHSSRFRGWVTDAAYMRGCHRVAMVTDHGDAHFIRVSPTDVFEDVHLFGKFVKTEMCISNNNNTDCIICGFRVPLCSHSGLFWVWLSGRIFGNVQPTFDSQAMNSSL